MSTNATLDVLNRKALQLESMVAMFSSMAGSAFEELSTAERGNFAWLMADLIADIRAAIDTITESRHAA
ncbi:hypothetical protein SB783_34385 [Paraburkholderia sp. SIMBA_009]